MTAWSRVHVSLNLRFLPSTAEYLLQLCLVVTRQQRSRVNLSTVCMINKINSNVPYDTSYDNSLAGVQNDIGHRQMWTHLPLSLGKTRIKQYYTKGAIKGLRV